MAYIFDTYAIIEIIGGNSNYLSYLDENIIINDFIFAELCYVLFRKDYPNSDLYLEKYSKFIIKLQSDIIKDAMKFRNKYKKKRLSIPDCISYFMAKDMGIKFLTGDKEFEGFEGVEFVK